MFHVKHSPEHEMHVKPPRTKPVPSRYDDERIQHGRPAQQRTTHPPLFSFAKCDAGHPTRPPMAKKHRIRKPGVVPCTRRRHAENARRTEHQVTGETPFAFARKACPRDGMISEFGCFLPFRASRLTKAPTKEGNPEHDAPSKEPKRLFRMQKPRKACSEGEGRTERRRRRRSRGADREAKAKAHRRNGRTSRKMTPKAAQAAGGSGLCLDE